MYCRLTLRPYFSKEPASLAVGHSIWLAVSATQAILTLPGLAAALAAGLVSALPAGLAETLAAALAAAGLLGAGAVEAGAAPPPQAARTRGTRTRKGFFMHPRSYEAPRTPSRP